MLLARHRYLFGAILDRYEQLVNDKTIVRDLR